MSRILIALAVVCLLFAATQVFAFTNYADGFEGYKLGTLDKNAGTNNTSGPNLAPNGSGNPWFGLWPPNARVVGTENGVTPHEGNKMVRGKGDGAADGDQNWMNIAYRLNGGAAISGGFKLHWWFYDQVGATNGATCQDYIALLAYSSFPTTADYSDPNSPGTGIIQRMSLGMSSNASVGVDYTKYQARIVGDNGGYANGWYNLNITRSVGWHEAQIVVGNALADGSNNVSFFIDDMVNPLLSKNSTTKVGYQFIEMNTQTSIRTAYFDDLSLTVPEPGGLLALGTGLVGLLGLIKRRK